jgi:hypothetical protein
MHALIFFISKLNFILLHEDEILLKVLKVPAPWAVDIELK